MPNQMTPKERWLAAIRMEPVDRLPFWPKLDGAYPRAQASPFDDMDISAIHDWMICLLARGLPPPISRSDARWHIMSSERSQIPSHRMQW